MVPTGISPREQIVIPSESEPAAPAAAPLPSTPTRHTSSCGPSNVTGHIGQQSIFALGQAYPDSSPLSGNVNLDLRSLTRRIGVLEGIVYCYVVRTVKCMDGRFVQTGSGPNFQGGLITLCTCKGQMRAGRDPDAWKGMWIAGITGAETDPHAKGHLFYLMRVAHAFGSQRDLWIWLAANAPEAADAKAADKHRLGDVYRPQHPLVKPYDPDAYVAPCPNHVHQPEAWRSDIDSVYYRRRPALLVGDPNNSFLWNELRVPVPFRVGRGCKMTSLDILFATSDGASVL